MRIANLATLAAFAAGLALSGMARADDGPAADSTSGTVGDVLDTGLGQRAAISGGFNAFDVNALALDRRTSRNGDGIVADQDLRGVVTNAGETRFEGDYRSGDNSVRGNAFAAYAGILNQGWNSGANANTQAATNVAARGSVAFVDAPITY